MPQDLHDELVQQLRGQLARAVVGSVDDTLDVQTANLTTHDGVDRTAVGVHQPYGHASLPPDQPLTVVLAIGGDQGQQVALQLASTAYRFGKLQPGESALYTHEGTRLHLRVGGVAELLAKALLKLAADTITLTAADGITITGPVTFASPVTFADAVTFAKDVTVAGNLHVGGTVTGTGSSGRAL